MMFSKATWEKEIANSEIRNKERQFFKSQLEIIESGKEIQFDSKAFFKFVDFLKAQNNSYKFQFRVADGIYVLLPNRD
ncbi:hypothetical protein [Endozoicomonas sp. SCSIO W0465]|uniref:hypothetical protein n=1 Tax=Endozoicomonas sp. SCSIO W0465 TaxID=2918516 RepID=UPI00207571AB|nr:hypothetical protein [Endozoicomonas sp. SCSIO W0465]USE34607.1 hypothetical protein MJO57_21030 [Endozoicomonas sp. SCSIO W0465]